MTQQFLPGIYVPICECVTGGICCLVVDAAYIDEIVDILVNIVVLGLTRWEGGGLMSNEDRQRRHSQNRHF